MRPYFSADVFIGFDLRMPTAFAIANASLIENTRWKIKSHALLLPHLQGMGLYYRPTERNLNGGLYDYISEAPMATEFAISRFLVPYLMDYKGWALFTDSDFLFRDDIGKLFLQADDKYAVMCVKHEYAPAEGLKMDGQAQLNYRRKNWSSMMLFNCEHPANRYLTPTTINRDTGRALHGFHWLKDEEIGSINEQWNWLEGHSSMDIVPSVVHFTRGTPDMAGYENVPYADEWNMYARRLKICK